VYPPKLDTWKTLEPVEGSILRRAYIRLGPFPDIAAQNHEVRFTPESERRQPGRSCPLTADFVAEVC
jgi:hypothetical protein